MAVVVNKTFLSQVTIDIGTDTYTSAFRDPVLVATAPEAVAVDASGSTVTFVGKSTYRFTGTLFQDWTSSGLSKNWQTNEGTQATVKYKLPGTQGIYTAVVVLKAVNIGSSTNGVAESTFDLPVIGQPTWSAS